MTSLGISLVAGGRTARNLEHMQRFAYAYNRHSLQNAAVHVQYVARYYAWWIKDI